VALIQNQNAERRHYDTAWTFNVVMGAVSAATLLLVATPASRFFREPRLMPVVMALAALPFLEGLQNIGIVEFRKQLLFNKEFGFLFAKKLASFVVVVPLAIIFRNYWVLVVGVLTGRVAGLLLSYLIQPFRPKLSLAAKGELFHFSKWLYANNLAQFFIHRAPDLVIGRIAGPQALGLFNVSHEIAYLPTHELVAPINRAIFPGYAKKSGDLEVLRQGFLDVISIICLMMIPAAIGIYLTSDLVVAIFLGDKWLAAEPLIKLLAMAGLMFALQTNPAYVHFAMGNPKLVSMLTFLYAACLLPVMVYATKAAGPMGAALAYIGTAAVVLPISYGILMYKLEMRFLELLARIWRPLLSSAVMAAVVTMLRVALGEPASFAQNVWHALTIALSGIAVYGGTLMTLWRLSSSPDGAERFALDLIRQKLTRRSDSGGTST